MNKTWLIGLILGMIIMSLFFFTSKKEKWEKLMGSTFECGFTSYYFSRFSFSIHYLIVAMIFLFFDLELCFLMPFLNEEMSNLNLTWYIFEFVAILLAGLILEWKKNKMEWKD